MVTSIINIIINNNYININITNNIIVITTVNIMHCVSCMSYHASCIVNYIIVIIIVVSSNIAVSINDNIILSLSLYDYHITLYGGAALRERPAVRLRGPSALAY